MFINYDGKEGNTKRYTLTNPALSDSPLTIFSTPGQAPRLVQDGNTLDEELSSLILEEVKTLGTEIAAGNPKNPLVGTIEEIVGPVYERAPTEPTDTRSLKERANDDIRTAFNPGWYGTPDTKQREVMSKYGIRYERDVGQQHGKLVGPNGEKLTVACTPSDVNSGRQIARKILNYLLSE